MRAKGVAGILAVAVGLAGAPAPGDIRADSSSGGPSSPSSDAWLSKNARCWTLLPSKQALRLQSILRTWPEAVRRASAAAYAGFPCNMVGAVAAADKAIARHVRDNPLPISYDFDWNNRYSWPGFQADRHYRTILQVSKEMVQPTGRTRRRDCIGMQDVAFTAVAALDAKAAAGVHVARLIIGNNPIYGRAYNAAQYLTGGNPVDGGVHHIAGIWPVFKVGGRVRGADGEVPEYAVILDYWITQDAADPMDLMTKEQFTTLFDGLERAGPLRAEE